MDRTLESIIGGGILSLESDTDIPQMDVTTDDFNEAVVDGISEAATIEHFIMTSQNISYHVNFVKSIENGKYFTSAEDGALKKIGNSIADAITRLLENIANFFLKVINHVRSIGINEKCKFIGMNRNVVLNKYKNTSTDDTRKVLNPEFVKEFQDMMGDSSFSIEDIVGGVDEEDEKRSKTMVAELKLELTKPENRVSIPEAITSYLENALDRSVQLYTGGYEKKFRATKNCINKMKQLSKRMDTFDADEKAQYRRILNMLHVVHSVIIRMTPQWITLTNIVYKATKELVNDK